MHPRSQLPHMRCPQAEHNIFRPGLNLQRVRVLFKFDWRCSAKGTMPKRREHCCSASCKRARENANSTARSVGPHTLYSFGARWSKRSRRTHVPATIHPNEKAKPLGPGSRLPGFGSQVPDLWLFTLQGGQTQWLHEKASSDHLTTAFRGNVPWYTSKGS